MKAPTVILDARLKTRSSDPPITQGLWEIVWGKPRIVGNYTLGKRGAMAKKKLKNTVSKG